MIVPRVTYEAENAPRGINPKIVSEMLGHSSVAITLDIYSHVLPDMQQAASEELGRALFGVG